MANHNYIISIGSQFFGGWGQLGEMKVVPTEDLAYRFSKILAERNLPKVTARFSQPCRIVMQNA